MHTAIGIYPLVIPGAFGMHADGLQLTKYCTAPGLSWSLLKTASANSNLAIVLAGFLVAAIPILYNAKDKGGHIGGTLSLFASSIAVLGLSSYLFSAVAGADPEVYSGQARTENCIKVWNEGLFASSLLAVGSVAIAAGIGWLLTTFGLTSTGIDNSITRFAARLPVVMIGAATALLAKTVLDYLQLTNDGTLPEWQPVLIDLAGGVVFVACAVVVEFKAFVLVNEFKPDKDGNPSELTTRALAFSTYLLLAMALLWPFLVGWIAPLTTVNWLFATLGYGVSLTAFVAIAFAVPKVDHPRQGG